MRRPPHPILGDPPPFPPKSPPVAITIYNEIIGVSQLLRACPRAAPQNLRLYKRNIYETAHLSAEQSYIDRPYYFLAIKYSQLQHGTILCCGPL